MLNALNRELGGKTAAHNVFDIRKAKMHDVESVHRTDWDVMSTMEQRRVFALDNVHVVGASPFQVLPDVSGLDSEEGLSLVIDLDRPLICHGAWALQFT